MRSLVSELLSHLGLTKSSVVTIFAENCVKRLQRISCLHFFQLKGLCFVYNTSENLTF